MKKKMNQQHKSTLFVLGALLLCTTWIKAQTFEFRSVNKGSGVIGIEVRETSGTNTPSTSDFVTDMVFGLVWDTAYGVNLSSTITTSFSITKAGTRTIKGSKYFQAFYANNTPYAFPANWTQNSWVEVASIANTLDGTNTGTFEIAGNGFHVTTDPNFGLNLSDFSPSINGNASNVALPVDLLLFDAQLADKVVNIRWVTANEVNVSHFEIERSEDGNSFTTVASAKAKGNSAAKTPYTAIDPIASLQVPKLYYRLKTVDLNGETSRSSIVKVDLSTQLNNVVIYPCPFNNAISLYFSATELEDDVQVELYNALGQLVHRSVFTAVDKIQKIATSHLAAGVYQMNIIQNGEIQTVKLIK